MWKRQLTILPWVKLSSLLVFMGVLLVLMAFIPDMRFTLGVGSAWILLLYLGYRMKVSLT
ncbi:hypothetical protein [Desulfosporosinus metallidurans]|uniref:Uncharacterized protein n=1 Tax=Desulfosporosinus metallidurans TaxID=1888891 RepID=A0A1Q8QXM1_9FIRM|nr:hypothetical protein [Desulfosporosinus metallidurans]OLN32119.1 hypothetical protein DSOL_1992 [Desulfosporosinus metallidurans]